MSRVVLPHTFESGDVINPEYVNENFEALAEAANNLSASNIPASSIPQEVRESRYAIGQINAPFGDQSVNLAIANGGDGAEFMLNLVPNELGSTWVFGGVFPIDITIVNVSWCFGLYPALTSLRGYILVHNAPWVAVDGGKFSSEILLDSDPDRTSSSPNWVDSIDVSIGWNKDEEIWLGVAQVAPTVTDGVNNYLIENMSITLTYRYELFE